MTRAKWTWMPHPGHFICARWCRFHLNTYVGKYIVSTVGEYVPGEGMQNIMAQCRGIVLKERGDAREREWIKAVGGWGEDIGCDRKFETMVFPAKRSEDICCPFRVSNFSKTMDFAGYNTPDDAYKGHMRLCAKWSKKV